VKAEVEIITPAYAKQLLSQNPKNRNLSGSIVDRYALDMREGRWQANGQPIIIDRNGNLLDGQHRCAAIIKAGVDMAILVVRNVEPGAFETIDTGKPRTLKDLLAIEGYTNAAEVAGAGRLTWNYAAGVNMAYSPNRTVLNEFIRSQPYIQEIARKVASMSSGRSYPKVPLTSIFVLGNAGRAFDKEVASFLDGVIHGEGLQKGDPRLTLREWVTYHKLKSGGRTVLTTDTLFAAAGRAWNAYASGKSLTMLKGLAQPTRTNMPIVGYDPKLFSDVPDLEARWAEVRRLNLAKGPSIQANVSKMLADQRAAASA
jgi:hypothetical protein